MYNALKYSGVSQLVSRKPLFKPCFLKSIKPITHVTHTSDGTSVFYCLLFCLRFLRQGVRVPSDCESSPEGRDT